MITRDNTAASREQAARLMGIFSEGQQQACSRRCVGASLSSSTYRPPMDP